MKSTFAMGICAALCASAGGAALAQGVAQPDFYKGDVSAFHGTPHTLTKAIHMLHSAGGDRIVDIRFARENGLSGYDVVMQKQGRFSYMRIDEKSGQVVGIAEASAPDWVLGWEKRAQLRFDRRANVPLTKAIFTAEAANNNAPAIAAGIAVSAGASDIKSYNVILDMSGHTKRVAIDATNGEIISDPGALS